MIDHSPCPLCGSSDHEALGRQVFERSAIEGGEPYVALRLRVLFEIWRPGEDRLEIMWSLCQACGFVSYRPRPEEGDLDRKYRFLAPHQGQDDHGRRDDAVEARRARVLSRDVAPHLPTAGGSILDFGGGDGHLLLPLGRRGHRLHVLDYTPEAVDGVERLGATLEELDAERRFDAIVCSHVLEHVADPVGLLRALAGHLAEGGSIHVEVPMEIWRGPPAPAEPVTHVNYFVPATLGFVLAKAGLVVGGLRLTTYLHSSGAQLLAVKARGRRLSEGLPAEAAPSGTGVREARSMLAPGLFTRLRVARLRPRRMLDAMLRRVGLRR